MREKHENHLDGIHFYMALDCLGTEICGYTAPSWGVLWELGTKGPRELASVALHYTCYCSDVNLIWSVATVTVRM